MLFCTEVKLATWGEIISTITKIVLEDEKPLKLDAGFVRY
jgi:hypothetical protein